MEIQPNQRAGGLTPTSVTGHETPRAAKPASTVSFEGAAGLDRALQSTPNQRAEEVSRAQSLKSDNAYPPPETIRKLSNLLAMHLEAQSA